MRQLETILSEYHVEPILTHALVFLLSYSVIYIVLALLQETVEICVQDARDKFLEEHNTTIEPLLPLTNSNKETVRDR